jgi:HEAT repeat protein
MTQPSIPNAQSPRRKWFAGFLLVGGVIIALGLFLPGSPIFLQKILKPALTIDGLTAAQLQQALTNSNPDIRRQAASDLGKLNIHASKALPDLISLVRNDPDDAVRTIATDAVVKLYPVDGTDSDKDKYAAAVVNELTAALADRDPRVRMNTAAGLLKLRARAQPAVPALILAAANTDNDTNLDAYHHTVRQMVLRALGEAAIGTAEAVPTFTAILDSPTSGDRLRMTAAVGLGRAGEHARSCAPRLRALLADPNADVRVAAEEALALVGATREGEVARGAFDKLELPESERERLWEIEHRVNVLNRYGLTPLADAVTGSNRNAIEAFFTADFTGFEPTDVGAVKTTGFAAVERRAAGDNLLPLTGPQFAARLLEWRAMFTGEPSVRWVTATLSPKVAEKPDGEWEGVTQLRIVGDAIGGGKAEVTAVIAMQVTAATEKTFGGTGWLKTAHIQRQAVARSPGSLFDEVAVARGLDTKLYDGWTAGDPGPAGPVPNAGGVYVCDFNRDGYLDVLVVDLLKVKLYRGGAGGKFVDMTKEVGLPEGGSPLTACWVDLDGDGWDDLLMNAQVYRNNGGTKFEDVTALTNLGLSANLSAILPADFDRDGKLDLYLTRSNPPGNLSWLEGAGSGGQGNRMVRNLGNWKFEDVTRKSGTHGGYKSSFTAAWLDADNDGWPDLHVPNEFGDGELFINQKDGTFKPRRLADRPVDFGTMGLAAGDVNNDGRIDLYCANMYSKAGTRVIGNLKPDAYPPFVMAKLKRFVAGSELHLNQGDLTFKQVAAAKQLTSVGWVYGAALADLNGDGFLDIYATAGYISRDRRKPDG